MSDEDVNSLCAFIDGQLSREDCRKLLRVSNNDVTQAINKFYDKSPSEIQEIIQGEAWDGSVFSADRYGQDGDSGVPSFRIDYAPGMEKYPHSGAPSRPPSRTSHRSGASGDVPLQSVETGPQESGVTGATTGAHFGPANRPYYENNQWALVPASTSAEVIPDAAPSQRKREEDGPVILKPVPTTDYLPALLTILHSIPLFRNALLAPAVPSSDYSVSGEWWKGHVPDKARTVDYGAGDDSASEIELLHETQRLMAFLDTSDRAYGSIDRLQSFDVFQKARESSPDDALAFLMAWGTAYQNHTPHAVLNAVLRNVFQAAGRNEESWMLDATIVHGDPKKELTIYDVLDESLFDTISGNAHIVDVSNVLILRLTAGSINASSLNCKFPATFFADRYLEKNKASVEAMSLEMKQYKEKITEIDNKAAKLKYTEDKETGKPLNSLKLLKASMFAFQSNDNDSGPESSNNTAILSQLQSIYDSVERKINALEEEKNKIRETLDGISSRFKGPIDDGTDSTTEANIVNSVEDTPLEEPLTSSYKLQGVSTRPGVYYLLHPDIKSDVPGAKQWWRMEYNTATTEAYIFRERVTLAQVLEKASSEHSSALLVYANEAAMSVTPAEVPPALGAFVKQDNLRFLEELQSDFEGAAGGIQQEGDWDNDKMNIADDYAHYGGSSNIGGSSNMSVFGNQFGPVNNFDTMSASQFHALNEKAPGRDDEEMSSTTLTPNTEVGDDAAAMEMREIDGGMGAWVDCSNASSETVGRDSMDVGGIQQQPQTVNMRDVEMGGTGASQQMDVDAEERPSVRHIESLEAERKGG
ncbi:hypothetical protein BCR34DRAFT_611754 [Clohesyomyces aquaticus]|uniref:Ubiquitin interaction motif protein n=1 Tax=Clohesyomyces aquaticus TaxID=1231657 RepID=A0A1Y2A1A8_9PLEO|nr:hypothetical protein BCR34DRAFT_611754 [Clohesyomyces aquaticus]